MYVIKKIKNIIPDKLFLKITYKRRMKKKLDLTNPKTFNEKLQWLKLYDRNPEYIKMVDKYEVKKYVSSIIGNDYIIPTLGIYDSFDEIDFKKLPTEFVMKCTHDSGSTIVCNNIFEIDINQVCKKINEKLKKNFYYSGREWPYKNVKPRIIIEKYMIDNLQHELMDYKFFCFNGNVKFFKVDFNRFVEHRANYYDINLNLLSFGEIVCPPDNNKKIIFPSNINKMIELSEKISKNIPFVRIDFYNVNGKIYFGEMTFYPAAGFGKFEPEEWDKKLGDMLELPKEKLEEKDEK